MLLQRASTTLFLIILHTRWHASDSFPYIEDNPEANQPDLSAKLSRAVARSIRAKLNFEEVDPCCGIALKLRDDVACDGFDVGVIFDQLLLRFHGRPSVLYRMTKDTCYPDAMRMKFAELAAAVEK